MGKVTGGIVAFGLSLMAACSQPSPDVSNAGEPQAFESPYFDVTISGAGPDVILMPGLASSGAVWDDTVAALQDQYTLHVVQVSGFAGAPANGNAQNDDILDDLASGLSAYTTYLDGSPTLIGHSLGGLVAMKTALDPDADLKSLIIVDVLPFFSVLMDPEATAESIAPVAAMMKAVLLAQSDEVFAVRQAEALRALVKSEADLEKVTTWSVDSDRAVMAQAMSEVIVSDLRAQIAEISIPTLVIYARSDGIENMESIEAFYETLYASIPDHRLVAIDEALHFVMLDQPDAFLAAIRSGLTPS